MPLPRSFLLDRDSTDTLDVMSPFSPNKSTVLSEALACGQLIIDFSTMKPLASGGQGAVFKVQVKRIDPAAGNILEELTCVLKCRFRPKTLPRIPDDMLSPLFHAHSEVSETSSLIHHILPLLGVVKHRSRQYALLPLCQTFLHLETKRFSSLKTDPLFFSALVVGILKNTLIALQYLHETKKMIHGDIKPDNIAFYKGNWCLADFDSATPIGSPKIPETNYYFKHPAAIVDSTLSSLPCNDIYALGIVLKTLLNPEELRERVSKPFGVFLADSAAEYQNFKEASMEVDSEDLSDILLKLEPIDALNKIATYMCNLDEKESPSAATLLELVNQLGAYINENNPDLNVAVDRYLLNAFKASPVTAIGFFQAPPSSDIPFVKSTEIDDEEASHTLDEQLPAARSFLHIDS